MEKKFIKKKEEIDSGYAAASKKEEYSHLWEETEKLEKEMKAADESIEQIAQATINGVWSYYYLTRKFARTKENIDKLAEIVSFYYLSLSRDTDSKLKIAYGYLLEVITSELREDFAEAERIGEEVRQLSIEVNEPDAYLKEINGRGLRAEKAGNYEEAIEIFGEAEKKFSQAVDIPNARLNFAHCLNNQAKNRILLSDRVNKSYRLELLKAAVGGLLNALDVYKNVPPSPPVKHIEGVIGRLVMASIRVLNYYGSTKYENDVKKLFEAKKLGEAIDKILEAYTFIPLEEISITLKGILEAQKIIAGQKEEEKNGREKKID